MRVLVVGGSGSGKSAFAEQLACSLSSRRTYIATMESQSSEAQRRIARHRAQRAGLGFRTIECPRALPVGDWPIGARPLSANGSEEPDPQTATGRADWPKVPLPQSAKGVALVEDLGNLVANALFAPDGAMQDPQAVVEGLTRNVLDFSRTYEYVVVVGNLVGCEGFSPYESTQAWVRAVGTLCCKLAADFDAVVEVTVGIPQVLKGELP